MNGIEESRRLGDRERWRGKEAMLGCKDSRESGMCPRDMERNQKYPKYTKYLTFITIVLMVCQSLLNYYLYEGQSQLFSRGP